jgi:hypothetical protein
MNELISVHASSERIEEHARKTDATARARGGDIAKAAVDRFTSVLAELDVAAAALKAANAAAVITRAAFAAEEARTRNGVVTLRNTMWGVLGRPRHSPEMDQVFPGGAGIYLAGPPTKRPLLMRILASRIRAVVSTRWTADLREEWAKEVDDLRVAYEEALAAHQPADAAETVAEATHRTSALNTHVKLRAFKRDLLTLGLSNAQVHDIIPNGAPAAASTKKQTGTGTTPGSGAPAPDVSHTAPVNNNGSGSAAA